MSLKRYLDTETLNQLASLFSDAAGTDVSILSADGTVAGGAGGPRAGADAAAPPPAGPHRIDANISVDGRIVGAVVMADAADARAVRILGLMRDVLARLCAQAGQIRNRVEELAAGYRLTEFFTGRTDLKEVHQLVAETMVKVTGADACSIRVLNDDRTELVTMAVFGLSDEYMGKGPILLADSRIDQEVLATGQCVYIADERSDPRVLYPAEARREGIVSALCAPMAYKGGIEGVIRVYTRRRHDFEWFETNLIRAVASQAAAAIVNARLYAEALRAERIRQHLRTAAEVQRRMIPPGAPEIAGLQIGAIYVPCFELGGDFYDFIELPNGNLGVCVADVVGKGIRASLLMASARSALRAHAAHVYELSRILSAVNEHMWRGSLMGDFLTAFYGVLDLPNRRLTYCNAGHEPAMLVRDGQVTLLTGGGGVLGIDPAMRYTHEVRDLAGGDVLVVCTDGVPEAINFRDEAFGRQRVQSALLAACGRGESAEGIAKHILWETRRFAGLQARFDDLTLVAIKVQ